MSRLAACTIHDGVAVVTIDNPPVNALGARLRGDLFAVLSEVVASPEVAAIVLTGSGRNFVAGADISEIGRPPVEPTVTSIIELIEDCERPTIAAINGNALGGGLELAMACHYRVATPEARLGLPEVRLGLLPGAGGTQRLPRLVGAAAALDMIVTGSEIGARKASGIGLVDALSEGDLMREAIALAQARAAENGSHVAVRYREDKIAAAKRDLAGFEAHRDALLSKRRGLRAPQLAALSVGNALTLPFDDALAAERGFFLELASSDESKALRHLFFAEREAAKLDGVTKEAARAVRRVGIVGAGTMGRGIAMAFLNAGMPVALAETDEEALAKAIEAISASYAALVRRGSLSEEEASARRGNLSGSVSYDMFADCDLVIEAVFEDMALKKTIFAALAAATPAGTILATNTSWLDVNEIAAATDRPQDVLGLHFFSPAHVMKLLEIVRGERTSPAALATALKLARRIGKVPVVVGVGYGFVGNRMLAARNAELERLMLEGAMPTQIDRAFRDFGWPMGPFEMTDLAGLDVGWRNRRAHGKTAPVADALCEMGRFGQKTGRGFHLYPDGSRKGVPDPEVEKLIRTMAEEAGIAPRAVSFAEILERTHYPMVNAGAQVVEEGIARRAADIDVVWVNGYGFPAWKGGPMFWARKEGLSRIERFLARQFEATGSEHFRPSPMLPLLAASD
ncbi:3-hydroxyacyl-CoA dehydrogenase NAD-binding domain-containing protein [Rhodoligotrophos defluvii]|uniref:3-hydroxyacyl-CoA dehydrogenase NAD-binding domain-containing protein n=1 Tax=Rhodoligotrophos defluvii TaxID=2561934 RepID=UPI0010C9F57E|nr:3-hydroxyacyl-CoA dehydrogenase NAD-binding domain-containing protein [Rhodoligotrophos defluvii]